MPFPTDIQLEIRFVDGVFQVVDVICGIMNVDDRIVTVACDCLTLTIIDILPFQHTRERFPESIEVLIEVADSDVIEDPTKMLAICAAHITGLGATGGFWEQKDAVVLSQRLKPFDKPKVQKKLWDTDSEVQSLLGSHDPVIGKVMLICLLSGMRAGEAAGLLREDLVPKGNLGQFFYLQPNQLRLLKTDAAERLVPMHSALEQVLSGLPNSGPLFPDLKVNDITKRFAKIKQALGIDRQGLVFHSTRKWFITQCERTGVPEHFTASIVGHKSARSENGITYSIYSAGISDEQKRSIVDQIRLPGRCSP